MSDSDTNYTVVPDDDAHLSSVGLTLSRTLNVEVEDDSVILCKKKWWYPCNEKRKDPGNSVF